MPTLSSLYQVQNTTSASVTTNFTIPAVSGTQTQEFDNVNWVNVGQYVHFSDGVDYGVFKVTVISGNTLTLENVDGDTSGTTIGIGGTLSPSGVKGVDGATPTLNPAVFPHIATPSAPSTGNTSLYAKSDNKLYFRPAGGSETEVGAGGGGGTTFADNAFRIQDNGDSSKQIAFEASGITTATTRTLTVPDNSGTIAVAGTLTDKSLYYYDSASKLFKPVAIGTTDQVLVAKPSLDPPYQFATSSGGGREVLTGNRTYYVRTDGSDSNNGLANTAGGAFLTPGKAISTLLSLDGAGYEATIKLTGTFTSSINLVGQFVGFTKINLEGDPATPTNATINVSSAHCITVSTTTPTTVSGVYLLNSISSGNGITISGNSFLSIGSINFGAMGSSGRHIFIGSGTVNVSENYTISGGCYEHALIQGGASIYSASSKTITLTGTPAFSGQFISAEVTGTAIAYLVAFSGSGTGKRYSVTANGVINTYGGGASYFPGNVSGTTATGGQYA